MVALWLSGGHEATGSIVRDELKPLSRLDEAASDPTNRLVRRRESGQCRAMPL
jgi:hypothetical protein